MNNAQAIESLSVITTGWTASCEGGMLCCPSIRGGIIDSCIATGEWFVVFSDDRKTLEGFDTRDDAIEAFAASSLVAA